MRWTIVVGLVVALGSTARANTVVVVIDRSLPVEKLEVVTQALSDAVGKMDPADQIAVVGAGPSVTNEVGLQSVDAKKLRPALGRIRWADKANLAAALDRAAAIIAPVKATQRTVLIVTDDRGLVPLNARTLALARKGIRVSTLGYQSSNGAQLDALAATGNGAHHAADSRKELFDAFVAESGVPPVEPTTAIVLVIDRSGSMSGAKLEAAKESARVVIEVLSPNDWVSVVAFDSESQVFVRPQRAANRMRIGNEISRLDTGGGTNIFPGLKDARDILAGINADRKIVVLLTDGEAPPDGIAELVDDMHAARISVTAVGLQGADRSMLSMIADHGGGRLYMVEDIGALPKIFMKETSRRP